MWCVSHVGSRSCCDSLPELKLIFSDGGGGHYDPTPGVARPTEDGKRRLIRGGGGVRLPGQWYCSTPGSGGGATPVAAPQPIKTDDVSDTAKLFSGGGGAPVVPSRMSVVLVEETNAGDTSCLECPCDDQERQPLAGTNRPLGGTVSEGDTQSTCGGGGITPFR